MSKPITYSIKTTVTKGKTKFGNYDEYTVVTEGSGFTGEATDMSLGTAFEDSYTDLMAKVSEAIFKDNA